MAPVENWDDFCYFGAELVPLLQYIQNIHVNLNCKLPRFKNKQTRIQFSIHISVKKNHVRYISQNNLPRGSRD